MFVFDLVNTNSPLAYKSPGKDYGINERIELGKEKIISGFDRWKLAEANGTQCVNIIHNLKEKVRSAGESPYPSELETYCKKLEVVQTVFEEVIKYTGEFRKEISGSISILESMNDNEELKYRLVKVQEFLDSLVKLYETSLMLKKFITGEWIKVSTVPSTKFRFPQKTSRTLQRRKTHRFSSVHGAVTQVTIKCFV